MILELYRSLKMKMVQLLIALQIALSLSFPKRVGVGEEPTFFSLFSFSGFEIDTAC